jgi:HSP20 family protein
MRYRRLSYHYTGIVSGMGAASIGYANEPLGSLIQASFARPQWQPPADLYETPTALIVKVEIAGMADEDFEISLYENALVIEGVRAWEIPEGDRQYHALNIHYGAFRLDVPIDLPIDRDRVQVRYDRGFLYVMLPKV